MARSPSPWYWPQRNSWFTILNGQRHHLGDHPADLPTPTKRKAKWVAPPIICERFHALLGAPKALPARTASGLSVPELLDKFLDWTQKHKAKRTYEWYRDHLQSFLDHLGSRPIAAADLKPFHVVEWADAHPGWSPAYRRGAITAVQRPLNWAEELGYISSSPIKRIKKPQPQRRDNHITPEGFAELIGNYPERDPFRELLTFAWYTGCRPQEAIHLEARHTDLAAERLVLPKEEAKGKRRGRVILLHGPALEIVRRLVVTNPSGKLFRNVDGKQWKRFAIANRFDRLVLGQGIARLKELGIEVKPLSRFDHRRYADPAQLAAARKVHKLALRDRRKRILKLARQHGTKLSAYDLRHSFCQRLLENGVGHLAVAELMGHTTGRQVAETYSHMNRATEHLREALRRADAGASTGPGDHHREGKHEHHERKTQRV
jgi:integrase